MRNKKENPKILIIGKQCPPIGGVTVHVTRLIKHLEERKFDYSFISLNENLFTFIKTIINHKYAHLHSSNSYIRFIFSIVYILCGKKLIQTYHGNLGRFNWLRNKFDNISVLFTYIPIVINNESLSKAKLLNKRTRLISAFIRPLNEDILEESILKSILNYKQNYRKVFCTNAYHLSFDVKGNEIYGGTGLLKLFEELNSYALIFADPSGSYEDYFKKNYAIPKNVFIIAEPHSFYEVLKISDGFIRNTTTDGDALSIREAISLKIPVYASDCVDRPNSCILFETGNYKMLRKLLFEYKEVVDDIIVDNSEEAIDQLIIIYKKLIKK